MKKTIAWVLILTLLFSLVGCKRAGDEQGATNGEYIEGNGQQGSGDAPEKVTDWELIDPSGSVGKPQTPSDQQEQEQPDEQQQNEQQKPTDQPEKEEEPSKPEQKPQEVPDQEEEPDQPVTNPEEQPTEQPDNQPEVDFIEDPEDLEEEEEDFEEETPEED